MLLEQYFDQDTSTYTYLIADQETCSAALIDPVNTAVEFYLSVLEKHKLRLHCVLDTHTHADHISANGMLRDQTGCLTLLGQEAHASCIDKTLKGGDILHVGTLNINVLYTPGHTDDSYSFYVLDNDQGYLFTGDTLLINGTGRTDFQNGNAKKQYDSLFNILLRYPDETIVYPGHDYHGIKKSTVGREKMHNPRLQVSDQAHYVSIMETLNLPNPKHMDVAVPANRACGKLQ